MAKNEEKVLSKSLDSITEVADEIVFLDTGSTDASVSIAKKYTSNLHYWDSLPNHSEGYNFLNKQANCDYVINWDADFVLHPSSIEALMQLKKEGFRGYDSVVCDWITGFTEQEEVLEYCKRKLFLKNNLYHYTTPLHPRINFLPKREEQVLYNSQIKIYHYNTYNGREPDYQGYIKRVEAIVSQDPTDYYHQYVLGEEYFFAKRYQDTIRSMEQYVRLDVDNSDGKIIPAIYHISSALLLLHRPQEALDFITPYIHTYLHKSAMFTLTLADIYAQLNPLEATQLLIYFLEHFDSQDRTDITSYQRAQVYPSYLLAKLLLKTNQKNTGGKLLAQATSRNRDTEFLPFLKDLTQQYS